MKYRFIFLSLIILIWGCPTTPSIPGCDEAFVLEGFKLTGIGATFYTYNTNIEAKDANTLFVSGGGPTIYFTIDGGGSWNMTTPDYDYNLNDIYAAPSGELYAAGNVQGLVPDGVIFRSQDNGATWNSIYNSPNDSIFMQHILFTDHLNGFAIGTLYNPDVNGNFCAIFQTHDGGTTWDMQMRTEYLDHICLAGNSIVMYSWFDYILRSDDNGSTWISLNITSPAGIYSMAFQDGNTGYYSGDRNIYKTTDGGNSWTQIKETPGIVNYLHITPDKTLYIFGSGEQTGFDFNFGRSMIGFSSDGGENWIINSVFCDASFIKDAAFIGNDLFYLPADAYEIVKFQK